MEWKVKKQDKAEVAELAEALGLSPVTAWILLNRGLSDPEAASKFLAPDLSQLIPEVKMADMDRAVDRIARAVADKETVGVHGDYDVDGITGAALLAGFFREIGLNVVWRVPHRQEEGYGMKPFGVERLKDAGASLIVTVDCGISDFEAIERANQLDLDVIVVDHHQVPDKLPPALAIVNPHRSDCSFPDEITGVGAAFYLAAAVRSRLREEGALGGSDGPNLKSCLDLVALGTIADVAPLTGLNRVLVRFGLEQLNKSRRPGIIQLKRVAGLLDREVGVGQVSFQLPPAG